jgi:HlyD family type I secretion membrane fusion protein
VIGSRRARSCSGSTTWRAVRCAACWKGSTSPRLLAERDGLDALVFPLELEAARGRAEVAEIQAGRSGSSPAATRCSPASKPRLLALERNAAYLAGAQGDFRGRVAQAREAIAEARMQILNLRRARTDKAATELRDVQTRRAEIQERYQAADVQLVRREVLAPQSCTVFDLRYVTSGGVIPPGDEILDIVPHDDRLVVEARVLPTDIDVMPPGLPAEIVLPAYKGRTTPRLDGRVLQVSADALADERTGVTYYLARVEVDADELAQLDGVDLYPGMPAEALIVTGERTAFDYLVQPLRDSFHRAFRED